MPDPRLDRLAAIAQVGEDRADAASPSSTSPAWCAAPRKGEGLGNQFLANIREVDAIVHVLRCFEDADVTHVEGRIDPVADAETVETELMLADLDSLEKPRRQPRQEAPQRRRQGGEGSRLRLMERALAAAARRQAGAARSSACREDAKALQRAASC